ncbi:MAG: hypothetical protein Q9225_006488 [Loekoesia sp. 1 TL-2023]
MAQARQKEAAALRRAGVQSSAHQNRFIPIESQPNGVSMSGMPPAHTMPSSSSQLNDFNFAQPPAQEIAKRLSELQPRNFQSDAVETTKPFLNEDHEATENAVSTIPTTLPILPPGQNAQTHRFLPASQMGFPQASQNSIPAIHAHASSQLPNGSYPGFQTNNGFPQASQKGCCSKPSTEPSLDESNPLALESLTLSSPTTLVSSAGSPDQSEEPGTSEVSLKGKEPERALVKYNPMMNDIPQTTVYSVPSTYATAENPMTLEQQAQLQQSARLHAQNIPQYAPYGITGSVAPSAEQIDANDFMHECNCGPSCQCPLCAVHPYNPVANAHMEEMADLLASDIGDSGARSRPQSFYGEAFPGTAYGSGADAGTLSNLGGMAEDANLGQLMMNEYPANANGVYANGSLPASGAAAQHFARSNNYFTFEYSFPGSNQNTSSNSNGS